MAAAAAPTMRLSTIRSPCVSRFRIRMSRSREQCGRALIAYPDRRKSESLADAEVDPPPPRLRFAVHPQIGVRIQLVTEVESNRSDRRLISQTGADGVAQVVQSNVPRFRQNVAPVQKEDAAEFSAERPTQLGREGKHAVAACGQTRFCQRADLIAPPSTDAGGAAEKEELPERHLRLIASGRPDVAKLHAARDNKVVP